MKFSKKSLEEKGTSVWLMNICN